MTFTQALVVMCWCGGLWLAHCVDSLRGRVKALETAHKCWPPRWTLDANKHARCETCGLVDTSVTFDLPEDA